MIVVDVDILVAAHLAHHPHHERSFTWLTEALSGSRAVAVPDAVWVGFLRIVTNRRIFDSPSTLSDAVAFARAVAASPAYRAVSGHLDGIDAFLAYCVDNEASADLVPDAYIASIARAYGSPVASFDRDFRRFDGIEIIVPE